MGRSFPAACSEPGSAPRESQCEASASRSLAGPSLSAVILIQFAFERLDLGRALPAGLACGNFALDAEFYRTECKFK